MSYLSQTLHILVIESCNNREIVELNNKTYSIGRQPNNTIFIDHEKICQKHATLIQKKIQKNGQKIYWILDGDLQGKKSLNGIFINGKKYYAKELKDGDIISFGSEVQAVYHTVDPQSSLSKLKKINDRTTLILSQNTLQAGDQETYKKNSPTLTVVEAEEKNHQQYLFDEQLIKGFDFFIKTSKTSQAEVSLRRALEKEEFILYYQPQYNIKTGKIEGLEALLRWQHPTKGVILPNQFISLAEETDLIIPIGEWVLKTACQQTKSWQKLGLSPLSISVNLSPRQFCDPNLKKTVSQVLNETGIMPKLLELELTEKTLIENETSAKEAFESLQNLGVHLSMDDFGIGYASLSYLQKFSFQTLKIAQSFIKNFTNKPQELALLSAIVAWGNITKLNIVAEGVETEEQLKFLRRLNVQKIQGYQISAPLTAEEATKFLQLHFSRVA